MNGKWHWFLSKSLWFLSHHFRSQAKNAHSILNLTNCFYRSIPLLAHLISLMHKITRKTNFSPIKLRSLFDLSCCEILVTAVWSLFTAVVWAPNETECFPVCWGFMVANFKMQISIRLFEILWFLFLLFYWLLQRYVSFKRSLSQSSHFTVGNER